MFKSPLRNVPAPKRSPINFVKTVASPRYPNNTKAISHTESDFSIDHFTKQGNSSFLSLQITHEKTNHPHRCIFTYTQQSSISQLIEFVRKQVNELHFYCRTRDLNIDYLLTLGHRKVKDLKTKRLELQICRIKIDGVKFWLRMFEIIKCVGTGGFSRVYLCRGYGQLFAMKVINKQFIVQNDKLNIIENQRTILELCSSHPFITKLHMSFQTKNYLFFCMEYCNGGELFNLLRKVRRMSEEDAKFYFLETLSAIAHLHSQKILYRDLKPQNIIIDSDGHIRLADYGLSKIMNEDLTHSFCGSAEYMAPQMLLKKGHSFQIDYYCLGALLYELLLGLPPYYSRNQSQLFSNILNKQLQFPPNAQLSKDLKKFLHRMLQKDTDLRFKNIRQILDHPWLKHVNMQDVLNKRLVPPFKTDMYQSNFDQTEFAKDEEKERFKIEKEKDEACLAESQVVFPFFSYRSSQLRHIQSQVHKAQDKKPDFSKKATALTLLDSSQKETIRPSNMKSLDSTKLNYQKGYYFQQSPRIAQNQVNPQNSRSGQKFKMFISQNPTLPSFGSQIIAQPTSSLISKMKGSQIINISGPGSQLNSSVSKLVGVRSVPLIQKVHAYSPGHERMGSPININNYINIYTNKLPAKGPQISFNSPTINAMGSQKKTLSYASNCEKSIANNSNSYKGSYNTFGSINGSLQRNKFNSLDKPSVLYSANSSSNFLKNNVYSQSSSSYLSSFKERFNPNQKIKKSYKTNQKFNFNLSNSNSVKF